MLFFSRFNVHTEKIDYQIVGDVLQEQGKVMLFCRKLIETNKRYTTDLFHSQMGQFT